MLVLTLVLTLVLVLVLVLTLVLLGRRAATSSLLRPRRARVAALPSSISKQTESTTCSVSAPEQSKQRREPMSSACDSHSEDGFKPAFPLTTGDRLLLIALAAAIE